MLTVTSRVTPPQVHFEKPNAGIDWDDFDLVILSGEVQMPARPNVLKIQLPLMRVPAAAVDAARERWHPKLADLPRPLIAVLVGGPTNPFVYKASVVTRLVELERRIVEEPSASREARPKVPVELPVVPGARGRAPVPAHGVGEGSLKEVVVAGEQALQDVRQGVAFAFFQCYMGIEQGIEQLFGHHFHTVDGDGLKA